MEVTGLVLGAITLVLYAFDNYGRALEPVKKYRHWKSTLKTMRSAMFAQQWQLEQTLELLNLYNPSLGDVQERLQDPFPDKYDKVMDIISKMDETIMKLMDKLDIDYSGKPKWSNEPAERVSWEWRRVKRSFGDKERQAILEDLDNWNSRLKCCFERRPEIPSGDSDSLTVHLITMFSAKRCEEARTNARVVHEALARALGTGCCSEVHPSKINLAWHKKGFKEPQHLILSFPDHSHPQAAIDMIWNNVAVQIERNEQPATLPTPVSGTPNCPDIVPPVEQERSPSISRSRKLRFWFSKETARHFTENSPKGTHGLEGNVQFTIPDVPTSASSNLASSAERERSPSPSGGRKRGVLFPKVMAELSRGSSSDSTRMATATPTPTPAPVTHTPIPSLCSIAKQNIWSGYLLHTEFDIARKIVFEKKSSSHVRLSAIPLSSILFSMKATAHHRNSIRALGVSRKDRFSIAASACWAVLFLCGSPWLAADWAGKDDIEIFIEERNCDGVVSRALSDSPTIVYKFGSVIPAIRPQSQSPARQVYSSTSKIIFTLGVLLIELCLNRSFDQLRTELQLGNMQPPDNSNPVTDDYEAARELNERVYDDAGFSYGSAVQRCLRFEFTGRDCEKTFNHPTFRRNFYRDVVAPVQATFDKQIGPTDIQAFARPEFLAKGTDLIS